MARPAQKKKLAAARRGLPCHHGPARGPQKGGPMSPWPGGTAKRKLAAVRTPEKGPSMSPNLAPGPRKKKSADFSADFRISFHVTTS